MPVLAVDTSSANVTYVFTDNFTITFGGPLGFNFTMDTTSIEEAIVAALETVATSLDNNLAKFWELALIFGLLAFTFKYKDWWLYLTSSLIILLLSLKWLGDATTISDVGINIVLLALACYLIYTLVNMLYSRQKKKGG